MATEVSTWAGQNPSLVQRGIDESTWNALCNTLYPGARTESVLLAVDYCRARQLDFMLKPVHLVPMQVKNAQTGQKDWRDVPMPGIGMYRIQADRSKNYAGADEPEFGPTIEAHFDHPYNQGQQITVRYPEWCKYTVYKIISGQRVAFTSKEYWLENYATASSKTDAPNAMWKKRPFGQLAKCAEAQALRKAWPEIGSEPTAEEMLGKSHLDEEIDITPPRHEPPPAQITYYPQESFEKNFPQWQAAIEAGKRTPEQIVKMVGSKGALTEEQKQQIMEVQA